MKDPVDALLGPAAGPGDEEEDEGAPDAPEAPPALPGGDEPPLPEEPPVPDRPPEEVIEDIQAKLDELRGTFAKVA